MEEILNRLCQPDSAVIKEASEQLRQAFKDPGVIPELCRILASSQSVQSRQYAAVLLRKKFSKPKNWNKLNGNDQALIKTGCLESLHREQEKSVTSALCALIAVLARHQPAWTELQQFILEGVKSEVARNRILGMQVLNALADDPSSSDDLAPQLKDWLMLCRKTLNDPDEEVCYLALLTLTHLVRLTGSDETNVFQQLIPNVLQKIQLLAKSNEERCTIALDIFDELIECEIGIVIPHIKSIAELCLALAVEPSLDDSIRIKAVTFLARLTRLKKKTIIKNKLHGPIIAAVFGMMASNEEEDDDSEDEDEDIDDSPALAASQALDTLALNLPAEKYITNLMAQVQPALASSNPYHKRAAYQALAVSAEGCQEHIRTKYLNNFLQVLGDGIRNENQIVRNSALYMLGQFSEHIQPEISNYAGEILPVLYQYLDNEFANLQPGAKESSSVSRIFYALDTFCENLEEKLVPHLPEIMPRALASLDEKFSIRIKELGISLIGSAANAVNADIIPYFDTVLAPIQSYLTMPHTDETQVLLTTSMSTLAVLIRCVGEQAFKHEFADQCIKIAVQLVTTNDDPDIRKCAYNLFGAIATIMKEEMKPVLPDLVAMMMKSIQSTEGINLETGDDDAALPLENLEDEFDDEINLEDSAVEDEEDGLDDVKAMTVENSYMGEKEQAILAIKEMSEHCGAAFYPFLSQTLEECWNMMDYPDDDVRSAATLACAQILIAYYKSGQPEGLEAYTKGVNEFIPKMCETVTTEEEVSVVVASLEAISDMLKECKQDLTSLASHPEHIVLCITKIMKGECACQNQDDEEGLEDDEMEASEQDEAIFEYAGDVLPSLGQAMTPDTFAPYFVGSLPLLVKKMKPQCSTAERSFAVGTMADCVRSLQGTLDKFIKHLLPMFREGAKDAEADMRQNSLFGLGELVLFSGPCLEPQYNQILSDLSLVLASETAPQVIDQVVGAISRFILTDSSNVPVNDIVPVLMNNLPLKSDETEYENVFKALCKLYAAGHEGIKLNLAKILECAVACQKGRNIDKTQIMPAVRELVKQIQKDFQPEYQAILTALPQDTAALLVAITDVE